ncbi:Aste57867_22862 [Aphanomyces stellatus]|uniref:Aste57867_22862 protein n=1 Tax=Aphanomyces stellatus TaxID=120398 RepID=A0A485LL37_9STRA|nr:hypothetical protein As57867_022791 [Aphanomyces stellatus]VFT99512.1 Aste57867_22862 [Aphanomyces stellatus]
MSTDKPTPSWSSPPCLVLPLHAAVHTTPLRLPLGPLEFLSAGRWLPITLVYDEVLAIDRLCAALAAALDRYPIFSGRLECNTGVHAKTARLAVRLEAASCGVSVSEGTSALALADVATCNASTMMSWPARDALGKCFLPPPHARDVRGMLAAATPLVHIALVHLAHDSGTVLAVEFAHCVADAASCFSLMKCWATFASLASPTDTPLPSCVPQGPFDVIQDAILQLSSRRTPPASPPTAPNPPLFVTTTPRTPPRAPKGEKLVTSLVFRLPHAQVAALQARLRQATTTNDVVSALLWQVSSSLPGREHRPSHLRMLLNFRTCLDLPPDAVGNMVYSILVLLDSMHAAVAPLAALANATHAAVDAAKRTHVLRDLTTIYQQPWPRIFWSDVPNATTTYVTNLSRYPFAHLVFGRRAAVDMLEAAYGAFPFMCQIFADTLGRANATGRDLRVVMHVPPAAALHVVTQWAVALRLHEPTNERTTDQQLDDRTGQLD